LYYLDEFGFLRNRVCCYTTDTAVRYCDCCCKTMEQPKTLNDDLKSRFVPSQDPTFRDVEVEMSKANGSGASELARAATPTTYATTTPESIEITTTNKHSLPFIENPSNLADGSRGSLQLLNTSIYDARGGITQDASSKPPARTTAGGTTANHDRSMGISATMDWVTHPVNVRKSPDVDPFKKTIGKSNVKLDARIILSNVQSLANINSHIGL
jgi:hypothetical protein